jgi:hypothetical protein
VILGGKAKWFCVILFCFASVCLVACFRRRDLFFRDGSGCRRITPDATLAPALGPARRVHPRGCPTASVDGTSADTSYKYPRLALENEHASCCPSTGSNTSTPTFFRALGEEPPITLRLPADLATGLPLPRLRAKEGKHQASNDTARRAVATREVWYQQTSLEK